MKYTNILFDLDGTITDSKPGIINSLKYSLTHMKIEDYDSSILNQFLGPALIDSFREFFCLSESDARKAVAYYREYYSEYGIYENTLFPGISELLWLLNKHNKKVFMATSKPTFYAREIVEHLKIDLFFKEIYGSNLNGSHTDKTEIICQLLEEECLDPDKTIMVGDTKYDITGALNNKIDSLFVAYGYGNREELKDNEPTFTILHPSDLMHFFRIVNL